MIINPYIFSTPYWNGSQPGILDNYPNAKVAYSVRALNSAYLGPILRVSRISDFVEKDIFALQNGDLDTATLTSFIGESDGYVSRWYDQSGNGLNVSSPVLAFQPLIVSAGTLLTQNTKPTLRFDGVNDGLYTGYFQDMFKNKSSGTSFVAARWLAIPTGGSRSLFHVTTSASPGNAPRFSVQATTAARSNMAARRLDGDSTANNNSITLINTTSMYLVTGVVDWANSDSYIYINGNLNNTNLSYGSAGSTSNTDAFSFSVGNLSNPGGRGMNSNSNICEVITYESIPSILNINTAINSYYNIYP